jgi:hypothetical protein
MTDKSYNQRANLKNALTSLKLLFRVTHPHVHPHSHRFQRIFPTERGNGKDTCIEEGRNLPRNYQAPSIRRSPHQDNGMNTCIRPHDMGWSRNDCSYPLEAGRAASGRDYHLSRMAGPHLPK